MSRAVPKLVTLVMLAAAGSMTQSCETRPGGERANVLLIVVDTMRADRLGSYGYPRPTSPRLDEFASTATRFANARATSSWTLPSVASIMTGLYPVVHGAERSDTGLSKDLDTLAQDLHDVGYQTAAFSANPAFVTPRQGLARGFDRFDVLHGPVVDELTPGAVPGDAWLSQWVLEAPAAEVTARSLEWLASRDRSRPFFLYVHYFDPHAAYTPPAEFAQRFGVSDVGDLTTSRQWTYLLANTLPPPHVLQSLASLYDAEIAATDDAIGTLLDSLTADELGSTITVVTSDHGEEFGEHGGVQHGRTLYDELLRVPLLLGGPGIARGKVVDTPVSLAALRATILELARVSELVREPIEPSIAVGLSRAPEPSAPVFADLEKRFDADQLLHRRALVDGSWKLLVDPARGALLFELTRDSGEHSPADDAQAARLSAMRTQVLDRDAASVRQRASAPPQGLVLDPAKREQLKALGYLQ